MDELRLRPLRLGDEQEVMAAHRALLAEDFNFAFVNSPDETWADQVTRLGTMTPPADSGMVPSLFLVADVGGTIVGRVSARFALNDFLAHEGGHIGYAVVADHRRRGYATEILRQALVIARAHGVDPVLVTCNDDNIGSARVIELCGGVLENKVVSSKQVLVRRYWIN